MVGQTVCPFNPWTLAETAKKSQASTHFPDVKSIGLKSMLQK